MKVTIVKSRLGVFSPFYELAVHTVNLPTSQLEIIFNNLQSPRILLNLQGSVIFKVKRHTSKKKGSYFPYKAAYPRINFLKPFHNLKYVSRTSQVLPAEIAH